MSDPIQPIDVALGELDDDRRAEANRLMREDAEFRRQVEEMSPVVSALEDLPDEAWDPPTAPPLKLPASRERSAGSIFGLRLPRLGFPALAATAACAIALLAVGFGIGVFASDDDPSRGETIALASLVSVPEQASGSATVVDGDRLEVDVDGLPPSADGRYEMWLLNSPDDLVSLGSFRVGESGAATVEVPLPTTPNEFAFIDVSVEPDDGNPAHSGNSILRGSTA
ncbi:MAG: anti-sigma factor domain-containing protein [Miltoncostaeaceae bacterium]